VGSWARLGWTVYFHELLEQPLLVRDHPQVEELRALVGSQDRLAKAAALWRVTRSVLAGTAGVLVVPYEELAGAPVPGFRRLYDHAGLTWTASAERRITRACTAGGREERGFAWSGLSRTGFRPMDSRRALDTYRERLTESEIARVRELTG
jgi:hypothetical protein